MQRLWDPSLEKQELLAGLEKVAKSPEGVDMRTQTLRLAVLSYLTIVLLLWMARILAVSGLISLPFGFSAVGAQANLVTGGLFLALGPGILGMRVLNRRQRVESRKGAGTK